jgi:aryl-alcohol dehydrogenase-like predicted oxidoreductase
MMSYGLHESRPWALAEDAAEPIVRRAVEGGITFFDTADVYNDGQSEVITGRLLSKLFGMREEYVLATKVHGRTDGAVALLAANRASLDGGRPLGGFGPRVEPFRRTSCPV